MIKSIPAQIVWFKRDLRLHDHEPLIRALEAGPVLPLYVIEPSILSAPDFDASHYVFIRQSLRELRERLADLGQPLIVRQGEAVQVLEELRVEGWVAGIWAHEETGNGVSYQRDRDVRAWAKTNRIPFCEIPSGGVVRRLKSRDNWIGIWQSRMGREPLCAPKALPALPGMSIGDIPTYSELGLIRSPRIVLQRGGERIANSILDSFLQDRGLGYRYLLSNPAASAHACSRLSPYLAWGSLSLRQVYHSLRRRVENIEALAEPYSTEKWLRSLQGFEERLHWRDHFIQKLEDEPRIEFENFHRGYDGLREEEFDLEKFDAWKAGRTGYPMIDACMRSLTATGWINFRMRALLVSFASYSLWLHWREPALHLAKLFLDYEPGIHYSQFQMQSGTTGINTVRIYNPTKQARDRDAEGAFIRRWVPELESVPAELLATPWLMSQSESLRAKCIIGETYPAPIVDHDAAVKHAKSRIYEIRNRPETQRLADEIRFKHGSRRPVFNGRLKETRWNGQLRMEFQEEGNVVLDANTR